MVDVVADFKFLLDARGLVKELQTQKPHWNRSFAASLWFRDSYQRVPQEPPNSRIGTLEAVTSLRAAASGRAIRRSAAIPDSRRRPAADPAGGATGSRSRPPPRCAPAGRRGKSECLRQTTADAHWAG